MATIHRHVEIRRPADAVWDALRDWGALHRRLAPGFVVGVELDGEDRIVTFGDGTVARERFVSSDDERRRLAWSIVGAPFTHHNGVARVDDLGDGRSRLRWTTDLLPDALAEHIGARMDEGLAVIQATLEAQRVPA
jgi:carbon monoxide dehydrogenase subunit G